MGFFNGKFANTPTFIRISFFSVRSVFNQEKKGNKKKRKERKKEKKEKKKRKKKREKKKIIVIN